MHRLTIQYGAPADAPAFDAHYREVHVPLALAVPGVRRFTLSHPRPLGGKPQVHMVAELWFDDADALQAGLRSPEMAATTADARTFDVESMTVFSGQVEELTADGHR